MTSAPSEPTQPKPSLAHVRRGVLGAAAFGLLVLTPVSVRVWLEGRAALAQAQDTEDLDLRIERLGHAARWRMPVATHDERALDALVAVGTSAADPEVSLAAYREARRALLSTRAWGVSDPSRFAMLNERIAAAMADREEADETDVGGQGDPYAYHLQLLQVIPGPDPVRAGGAAWAFVGWLAAMVGFVGRGLDDKGRLRAKPAARWGVAAMLLLVSWTVLLATA